MSVVIRAVRGGRTVINFLDKILTILILIVLLLMLAYGGYAIWDSHKLVQEALSKQYSEYKPIGDDVGSFDELTKINSDVIGWLNIYGTNIDYPIVQGEDDWKYINTNAKGEYALTGSLFLSSRNNRNFSDFNNIIYGHNMTPKVMFGNIKDFRKIKYFKKHKYGDIFYNNKHHGVVVKAFFKVNAYDEYVYSPGIVGDEARDSYLKYVGGLFIQSRVERITNKDKILILSTCSNTATNERHILLCKVTEKTYKNSFNSGDEALERLTSLRGLVAVWNNLSVMGKLFFIFIAVMLLYFLTRLVFKLKTRGGYKK